MKTFTESSGQLAAHGMGGARLPRSKGPDGHSTKDRSVVDRWPKSLRFQASHCNAGPHFADEVE